jgi:signal recognition particle receptor subunit beta
MASVNRLKRELLFKVVFYGPGLGGKTTSLQYVHSATKPENRGNLLSLATDTDRTLYFDYLPVKLLQVGDVKVKLQLYTVPGQVYYAATRKLVLSGADGIVFVADTQAARLDSNLESLDDLNANLAEQGRKLSALAHVFQWNKRDLPELVPLDELDRRLNLFGVPSKPTVATTGQGIFDMLESITRLVVEAYRAELPLAGGKPDGLPLFLDAEEVGLTGAIKELADSQPARSTPTARRGLARMPERSEGTGGHLEPRMPERSEGTGGHLEPRMPQRSEGTDGAVTTAHAAEPQAAKLASASASDVFSFAELWPAGDQEAAWRVEALIARRDVAGAIAACEDLLSRVLAAGSMLVGGPSHPPDPALVVALLGLDGPRYLSFRAVARGLRSRRPATVRDALECYAFAVEARRRLDRSR